MEAIFELERIAAAHWRGTEERRLGDWLLRAAEGFTGRANSALALGHPGLPLDEALAAVTEWYRARGLPPMIVIPESLDAGQPTLALDDQLSERHWGTRSSPAFVMVADLPLAGRHDEGRAGAIPAGHLPAQTAVSVAPEPDDAWAAMYHYRGQDHLPPIARKVLTSAQERSFVSIRSGDEILAIARVSFAGGWAGITAVEVSAAHRRRGLGTAITAAACREAEQRGIGHVFLQVEVTNAPAQALYERLGFRYSHKYRYRVAPS